MAKHNVPYERIQAEEDLIVEVIGALWEEIERSGIKKSEIAEKLGVSRAYVSQALHGGSNLTLRTLANLAWALESTPRFGLYAHAFDESRYSAPTSVGMVAVEDLQDTTEPRYAELTARIGHASVITRGGLAAA